MARKKVLISGGLMKSVNIPDGGDAGTIIAGYAGQTLTVAQLQSLLGVVKAPPNTQVPTGGGGGSGSASLVVAPGLVGGGSLVGTVPLRINRAQAAAMFVGGGDDDGGGGSGPPGKRGTPGGIGPAGPAGTPGGPRGYPIALVTEPEDPIQPMPVRGRAGPPGAAGIQGPAGRTKIWLPDELPEPPMFVGRAKASTASATAVTLAAAILADTPFAFWKCDDASTKLVDSSGNGFDLATVAGTPSYNFSPLIPSLPTTLFGNVSGIGASAAFNSWTVTSALGRTLPFTTWTFEFTCVVYGATARIFDWRTAATSAVLVIYPLSVGAWTIDLNNTNITLTGLAAPQGKVVHVVITCSTTGTTSTLNIYQNGVPVGSATATASTASGGTSVASIGGGGPYGGTTNGFTIGYTALYASVLSKARIAAHAAAAGLLAA